MTGAHLRRAARALTEIRDDSISQAVGLKLNTCDDATLERIALAIITARTPSPAPIDLRQPTVVSEIGNHHGLRYRLVRLAPDKEGATFYTIELQERDAIGGVAWRKVSPPSVKEINEAPFRLLDEIVVRSTDGRAVTPPARSNAHGSEATFIVFRSDKMDARVAMDVRVAFMPEDTLADANLNLTICMWLYRRLVITPYSPKTPKFTREQFTAAIGGLSTDEGYLQWLVGRQLRDRDRSPCYQRVKSIIVRRHEAALGKKISLPAPSWVGGTSR